MLDGGKLGAG
uniref:Uncharacterized protein n=1 Tax=Arundo donax TaxID=35708 RepID=A0A0A8YKT2_ARUDO